MKYFKTYEGFKKDYMKKIDLKDFKKIKKGSKIMYMGGEVEVLDNNGFVLKLKGNDGKTFSVNKSMFDHGGMIREGWGKAPDADKAMRDLKKKGSQIDWLDDADDDTKKIWKKAGVNPEDENTVILYSYVSHQWDDAKKILKKHNVDFKELEDPNADGESFIVFVKESKVTEAANVPSNIEKFAKERGVLRDVKQIARWAEKAGKRITGGTAIGKGYDTLVLDLTYQGAEVYFDTYTGKIKVNRQPVDSWKTFSKAVQESVINENDAKTIVKAFMKTYNKRDEITADDWEQFIYDWTVMGDGSNELDSEIEYDTVDDVLTMLDKKGYKKLDDEGIIGLYESRKINLKADHLSSEEYQKAKKLKDFDKEDWKWNSKSGLYDKVNEAKRGTVFRAAKKGSYPISLVVVKNGKVIDQELVNTPEAVPAAFNVIQDKHKGAIVHIEDNTGKRLFTESLHKPVNEMSSEKDGTEASNGKHKHEDHLEEDLEAMWKKVYGEKFSSKYPAVAKIIKQRQIKDKREIARIWDETYGENFEEEYPGLWDKLK